MSSVLTASSFLPDRPAMALWGGVESTVNRVGDAFFDQLERSGHASRPADLDRFAALGIRALRYPVLWERTAPNGPGSEQWEWSDARLTRLRQLGIEPIVGLLHHGSGPRWTSLLDEGFPSGLAGFAREVARRYPWVECYTPVNEPLTTARFSGLYGHWYPHGRDDLTFLRALLIQCRAIVEAMRAIRSVSPTARLIQTEETGKTFSTPLLAYQADFENQRRWLSLDLLCGKVGPDHPLWSYLRWVGLDLNDVEWFQDNSCPPDVVGVNYYVTSERYLDEHVDLYPGEPVGGNGRHVYCDVAAVRAPEMVSGGLEPILAAAWQRYRRPLAVTEAHLGCTREEQLRWLVEIWSAAKSARVRGVDVRAVTVWALLGSFDWDSLVTRADGHYEPGAFDLRAPRPRTTALAAAITTLASGQMPSHPVLESPGWWHRPTCFHFHVVSPSADEREVAFGEDSGLATRSPRPILITGATGTLGQAFSRICEVRGLAHCLVDRQRLDIAAADSVERALDEYEPWAVVNTAGYVRIDRAESEPEHCFRENTMGPTVLAGACARRAIKLVTFSSDLVFDGATDTPYVEHSPVKPLNVYGRSKAEAEQRVLAVLPSAMVVRTSGFFGPWDRSNFVTNVLRELSSGRAFAAATDLIVSPTYVPDLVNATLDLLVDDERGIWHLATAGALSWFDLARRAAEQADVRDTLLVGRCSTELGWPAPRPRYSALTSERASIMPPLADALARYYVESRACETTFGERR